MTSKGSEKSPNVRNYKKKNLKFSSLIPVTPKKQNLSLSL